ncbi:hypothetical protein GGE65_007585 [Skermanella aerolata]
MALVQQAIVTAQSRDHALLSDDVRKWSIRIPGAARVY